MKPKLSQNKTPYTLEIFKAILIDTYYFLATKVPYPF